MDEPTTGLDPQARHLIWERLRRLTQEGRTLILTTHFMEEAERLCRRIAIMDHGRIIAEGSPRALISEHIESQVVEVHGPVARPGWSGPAGSHRASNERAKPFFAMPKRSSQCLPICADEASLHTCTVPRTSKTCSSS
jgi:ABC-type multidrug transport system ATPase subunit